MKRMKTNELTGAALDWAVATSAELTIIQIKGGFPYVPKYPTIGGQRFSPSTDWSQAGPIIEREQIDTRHVNDDWQVWHAATNGKTRTDGRKVRRVAGGPTPLIAAMRCFVASRMGDEVEVPKELV